MKRNVKKILVIMLMIFSLFLVIGNVYAESEEALREVTINSFVQRKEDSSFNVEELITMYNELSETHSNEEIANIIEENSEEIIDAGISKDVITAGTQLLRTTDQEQLKEIINSDEFDANEIQTKIEKGETPQRAIAETITNADTATLGVKLLFANSMFVNTLIVLALIGLYKIIIYWVIFRKAGRHGWAVLIPFYRTVTYFKVCGFSPWWLLLVFVPIVGWLILVIMWIVSYFKLAEKFQRGFIFGLGLMFFNTLFTTILAISKRKYLEDDYEEEDDDDE